MVSAFSISDTTAVNNESAQKAVSHGMKKKVITFVFSFSLLLKLLDTYHFLPPEKTLLKQAPSLVLEKKT